MKDNRNLTNDEPQQPQRPAQASVHLSDYFAILREHKWVAMLPFLLILGTAITLTLFATASYKADALIEIETQPAGHGLVGDLQLMDNAAQVETEMEIMRSRRVAERAAATLAHGRKMSDFLMEVNKYRPLEVMLATVGRSRPACAVELVCEPLAEGRGAARFRFHFDEALGDGRYSLLVEKIRKRRFHSEITTEQTDIESGVPFRAFEQKFTLEIDGDPVGRTFELTLRSVAGLGGWVRKSVTVSQVRRNTGLINLGFKGPTPRLAKEVAEAVAESYYAVKMLKKKDEASQAVDFLDDQVGKIEKDLEVAEEELDKFRSAEGVTLLSEKTRVMVERVSGLEREQVELEMQQREQQRLVDGLEGGDVQPDEVPLLARDNDPTAGALASELATLKLQRAAMDDDLTDEHPDVRRLEARIRAARDGLGAHVLALAKAQSERTVQRIERVRKFLDDYKRAERELPKKERELAVLTRKVQSLLAINGFLLEKKHEAEIARASTFSRVNIVDPPTLPNTRVSPNLMINVLVGLFLAILAALATAFFAEYLDRSIKTPEELEDATGLPLFAALPSFKSIRSRHLRNLKTQMVTIEKPNSVLAEGYRSLRANIRFAEFESSVRSLAITSAVLGEGKTTTSLNLATVLAQAGSKVIVVDADMRRPATHSHLEGELSPGLTDVLLRGQDWRTVVRDVKDVEHLKVIHAGKKPDNPGALLDSEPFSALLAELSEAFDYVIFDVPPVLAVADAAAFFRRLDAVFLLVQWRRCPVDVVLAAKDQITRVGAKLRGVIFNGFDARKVNRRGYGRYGYYGYYGYGRYRRYGYGYGSGYGYGYGYTADGEREAKRRKDKKETTRI